MARLGSSEDLSRVLALPAPRAYLEGAFARTPDRTCWLGPVSLEQVIGWSVSGAAMRWESGRLAWDPAAAALARLRESVFAESDGTPLFGPGALAPGDLPGGLIDKLLHASDLANGYAEPAPLDSAGAADAYHRPACRWLAGLLPQDPAAEICCRAYDFATLAAAEQAAQVALSGGVLRLDLLSYPTIIAASLREHDRPGAAPLVDPSTARRLPFGAARAIVETADLLSEIGGPDPGVRFQRLDPRPAVDGPGALAPGADGSVPERADRPAG